MVAILDAYVRMGTAICADTGTGGAVLPTQRFRCVPGRRVAAGEADMEALIGATEVLLATAVTTACFVVLRRRHTI